MPWSQQASPNSTAAGQIARAVGVRLRERPAERGGRAARPEEEPDGDADGAADGDVLDPHEADAPARRLEDVEEDHERERERGLAGGERDRRRSEAGEQDRRRAAGTRATSCWCRSRRAGRRRRRTRRPCRAGRGGRSGRCSARSSAAPRACRARPRTSAARRTGRRRGPQRPGRSRPRMLLCSQTELRATWAAARSCAADSVPGTPVGWRPRRRCEPAAPLGGRRQLDVGGDLRDGEAQLLRPEARIERGDELCDAPLVGSNCVLGREVHGRAGLHRVQRVAELGQRGVERVGASAGLVEQVGAALEHRRPPSS